MQADRIEDIYTLSPTQQGVLFLVLSSTDSGMYLEQGICTLHGKLDLPAFEHAWRQVLERHQILRTAFIWKGMSSPVQVVHRKVELPVEYMDWREMSAAEQDARLKDYIRSNRERGFEFSEPPLMRLAIIRLEEHVHQLIWAIHHLIHDAWSTFILLKEVLSIYDSLRHGRGLQLEPSRPYRDYIAWIKRLNLPGEEAFWRSYLRGFASPTPLPSDKNPERERHQNERYAQEGARLTAGVTQALDSFGRERHLTLNTLMLGAWGLLLSHYNGREDVMFGTVLSGRPAMLNGVESMVGLFINTIPTRIKISPEKTFSSWASELQAEQMRLREYEFSQLRQIQNWSDVPRGAPLFESVLVFQNAFTNVSGKQIGDLKIDDIRSVGHSNYPLTMRITPGRELLLETLYDRSRFRTGTITEMLGRFKLLLGSIAAQAGSQLGALIEPLHAAEKRQKERVTVERRKTLAEKLTSAKPKAVKLSAEELIRTDYLQAGLRWPLVVQPDGQKLDLTAWVKGDLEFIERKLLEHGALLFRNFSVESVAAFEKFIRSISPDLLEYKERSTPRTHLGGNIYTSTEYPAHQEIAFHNEFSYAYTWPMKICFHCVTPAEKGGETPIADSREVFQLLNPKIRERFIQKKVMYVRNYGSGVDLSWQEAFQTTDRSLVEEHCRKAPMHWEWRGEDRLKTVQVRDAAAKHPKTGEKVWFNQAHLFHISNLEPKVRESMLEAFTPEDLPRNAYYGDGSQIEDSVLDEIREAYKRSSICFPWQRGDVLLLDNMLMAHGRAPFFGSRQIIVGMAEPFTVKSMI